MDTIPAAPLSLDDRNLAQLVAIFITRRVREGVDARQAADSLRGFAASDQVIDYGLGIYFRHDRRD